MKCDYCKKKIIGFDVAFGKDETNHIDCLQKKLRGDINIHKKRNYRV